MSETEEPSLPPQPLTKNQKRKQKQKLKKKADESEVPVEEEVVQAESEVPAEEDVVEPDTNPPPSPSSTPPPAPKKTKNRKNTRKSAPVSEDIPPAPTPTAEPEAGSPMSISGSLPAEPASPSSEAVLPPSKSANVPKTNNGKAPPPLTEEQQQLAHDRRAWPDIVWSATEPGEIANQEHLKAACTIGVAFLTVPCVIRLKENKIMYFGGE